MHKYRLTLKLLSLLSLDSDATRLLLAWWRLRRSRSARALRAKNTRAPEKLTALNVSQDRDQRLWRLHRALNEQQTFARPCNCVTSIKEVRARGDAFGEHNTTVCQWAWTHLLGECFQYQRIYDPHGYSNTTRDTLVFETALGQVTVIRDLGKHDNTKKAHA